MESVRGALHSSYGKDGQSEDIAAGYPSCRPSQRTLAWPEPAPWRAVRPEVQGKWAISCINRSRLFPGVNDSGRRFFSITTKISRRDPRPCPHEYHPPVSYTHLRAHETVLDLVCRLLLEKKKKID